MPSTQTLILRGQRASLDCVPKLILVPTGFEKMFEEAERTKEFDR